MASISFRSEWSCFLIRMICLTARTSKPRPFISAKTSRISSEIAFFSSSSRSTLSTNCVSSCAATPVLAISSIIHHFPLFDRRLRLETKRGQAPAGSARNEWKPAMGGLPARATPKKGSAKSNATSRRKVTSAAANAKTPLKADEPKVGRVTKQERVLTLLSHPVGASIEEMMRATDWQQHSVGGFLAGAVKKKLGFSLTSLKPDGGARHYRIETRRAR